MSRDYIAVLSGVNTVSSFCGHPMHRPYPRASVISNIELLSVECAFDWLENSFPEIWKPIVKTIAEYQGEPLPLKWPVILEDAKDGWSKTYLIVWLFIMLAYWTTADHELLSLSLAPNHFPTKFVSWISSLFA